MLSFELSGLAHVSMRLSMRQACMGQPTAPVRCAVWELLTGDQLYPQLPAATVSHRVVNEGMRPSMPWDCPPGYMRLMSSCWQAEPSHRCPSLGPLCRALAAATLGHSRSLMLTLPHCGC